MSETLEPAATVIHLLSNTFRYASRRCWDQIAKDIRSVYTAPTEAAAKERFVEFTAKWGAPYSTARNRGPDECNHGT